MTTPSVKQGSLFNRWLLWLACCLLPLGCSSHKPYVPGDYSEQGGAEKDSAPDEVRDWANIPDAVPRWEPKARYGNHSPYKVFGKSYRVMPSADGYRETGVGSWYGKKFSGRPTSSQEPYDPYAMTAAHKTLPLPTYVRVTNLDNQRSIIVRVNDRGPFHGGRIIDLSYAAAHKIGYAEQGTARVLVEAIPMPAGKPLYSGHNNQKIYLQAGAFRDINTAQSLRQQLLAFIEAPITVHSTTGSNRFHRVHIGPFADESSALEVQQTIRQSQTADPFLIRR